MRKGGQAEKRVTSPGNIYAISRAGKTQLPPTGVRLGIWLSTQFRTLHAIVDIYGQEALGKYL